jgi:hypothetical protein
MTIIAAVQHRWLCLLVVVAHASDLVVVCDLQARGMCCCVMLMYAPSPASGCTHTTPHMVAEKRNATMYLVDTTARSLLFSLTEQLAWLQLAPNMMLSLLAVVCCS